MSSSAYSSCTSRKNSSSNTSNFSVFEFISNKNNRRTSAAGGSKLSDATNKTNTTTHASVFPMGWSQQHRTSYPTSDYCSSSLSTSQELNESLMVNSSQPTSTTTTTTATATGIKSKRLTNRAETTDLVTIPAASEKEEAAAAASVGVSSSTSSSVSCNSHHNGGVGGGGGGVGGPRARLLSLVLQSPRRFSCNSDTSDVVSSTERTHPFWVPPQIAERSKQPRSSLPNTHISEINRAMLGFMHQTALKSGK